MDLTRIRIKEIVQGEKVIGLQGMQHKCCNRKSYGLVFVVSGRMRFVRPNDMCEISSGQIMMIPDKISYDLFYMEDTQFYVINFTSYHSLPLDNFYCFFTRLSQNSLPLLVRLNTLRSFKKNAWQLESFSILYKLLALLQKETTVEYTPSSMQMIIKPSIEYIEHHFDSPDISNEDLARVSKLSVSYFRKLFTECFQISPMRYVCQKRIEKAKLLLMDTENSIEEIAYSVGYNSPENFSRSFKKEVGVSPLKYALMSSRYPGIAWL